MKLNQQYVKQKYQLKNSKSSIKKAGRHLRKGAIGKLRDESIAIIHDFRASHSYPLMLIKNHLWRQAKKINPEVIIARRLKRLPTIINKLERKTLDGVSPNAIEVVRMQDIGGCRAIFDSYDDVIKLIKRLHESKCVHEIKSTTDYNSKPRGSGYRGVHLIFDCYRQTKLNNPWKGHKIEVQVRTLLQHAWSTAIEMIDFFEGTELKTGQISHEQWRRFFFLLGGLFSHIDCIKRMPRGEFDSYVKEIKHLEVELDVLTKLNGYNMITDTLESESTASGVYLITIFKHENEYETVVRWFSEEQRNSAVEQYDLMELEPSIYQTALIGSDGAKEIKQAYPNFFADTSIILQLLSSIVGKVTQVPDLSER